MTIAAEYVAAFTAVAVFVTVLFAFYSASVRRARDDARRQWQADLRTQGCLTVLGTPLDFSNAHRDLDATAVHLPHLRVHVPEVSETCLSHARRAFARPR